MAGTLSPGVQYRLIASKAFLNRQSKLPNGALKTSLTQTSKKALHNLLPDPEKSGHKESQNREQSLISCLNAVSLNLTAANPQHGNGSREAGSGASLDGRQQSAS